MPGICNSPSPLGVTIPSTFSVGTGDNVITSSVAVKVEEFSFVFVGTEHRTDGSLAVMGVRVS